MATNALLHVSGLATNPVSSSAFRRYTGALPAPGGTHAAAATWAVLADALTGTGLRADLVPAGGDGSGWHLRTQLKTLRVGGTNIDTVGGASVAVS